MPRPSITLTDPIDPGEAHPGATYDKHAVLTYRVESESGRITIETNDGWFEGNRFMPGILKTYNFVIHDPAGCGSIFNASGQSAMDTAILQWLIDNQLVDGTIT